jgi:hypothetical protein
MKLEGRKLKKMRRNCILLRIYGSRPEKEVDRKRIETEKGSRQEKN